MSPAACAKRYERTALILQGGGALGAYQCGVYQAMHEAEIDPDWITGVSIGAINAAIIAGNPREQRLDKLRTFWNRVTTQDLLPKSLPFGDAFFGLANQMSAAASMMTGQSGFFAPRFVNPWLHSEGGAEATSYYDTSPLRATLKELVDFDLLNKGPKRVSVGAVNIENGNGEYFDTLTDTFGPEHIMASGALPPSFPPVKVGKNFYWDGGIVSNTPLDHLLEQDDDKSALVVQVDLFNTYGKVPNNMRQVQDRQKEITYASRTRASTALFKQMHALRRELYAALKKVPPKTLDADEKDLIDKLAEPGLVNILLLIYQRSSFEGGEQDFEFSHSSMDLHWKAGYNDMRKTLAQPGWLDPPSPHEGLVIRDIHHPKSGDHKG